MGNPDYAYQKTYWETERDRRFPTHPVVRAFAIPKIKRINDVILVNKKENGNPSLLDIGCGNGFFTYHFEKYYDTTALDFSTHMLKNNFSKSKICASAVKLPFKNNSFDVTFCSNLLHHLDNPQEAVLEMKRVSRKYVILSEPNRNNPLMFLFGIVNKAERGTLKFSLKYMEKLIGNVELDLIFSCSMGAILPNKTPKFLLPFLKKVDGEYPCAFYNILIAEK